MERAISRMGSLCSQGFGVLLQHYIWIERIWEVSACKMAIKTKGFRTVFIATAAISALLRGFADDEVVR
jgi:hypothetical protein